MEFTTRHDLPSGGWVELRNHNYLRGKDRKALMRKLNPSADDTRPPIDRGFEAIDILTAMIVVGWSLPYEPEPLDNGDGSTTARAWTLPENDPSLLDELMAPDSAALEKLLAPARAVLMPSAPSPDQSEDSESPSGPGNA
jgi:hypothetical protein